MMRTVTARPYQHPIVKEYQATNPNRSKAEVEKVLLKKFGIKTSNLFKDSIVDGSPLFGPVNNGKRRMLQDHLYQLNMVLNDPKFLFQRNQILGTTQEILEFIFPDSGQEQRKKLAADLHYLMSHRDENHSCNFPKHAKALHNVLGEKPFVKNRIERGVDVYEGNTLNGRIRIPHGIGTVQWKDGSTYEGFWVDGKMCGPGIKKILSGEIYGVWSNGVLRGEVLIRYPNPGHTYEGSYDKGPHGTGTMIWPDRTKYEGNWTHSFQSGSGTITFPDGQRITSSQWLRGCLPADRIPNSELAIYSRAEDTRNMIGLARIAFDELINKAPRMVQWHNIECPQKVFPGLQGRPLAYCAVIDPEKFKRDPESRSYGPSMFDSSGDPCNGSGSYLNGFFACARGLATISAADLTLDKLQMALTSAFPNGYTQLNIKGSVGCNPSGAIKYYSFKQDFVSGIMTYIKLGLWYPLDSVMPYSNCQYTEDYIISLSLENETEINEAFNNYKRDFLSRIKQADGNKNQIKAAIILFISQVEATHFFNNGNTRLSSQILLNKLLVEYEIYDDKLGSALFIPNGFAYYVLSHLNHFLQTKSKKINECTGEELVEALQAAILWVDFGHECYQKLVR